MATRNRGAQRWQWHGFTLLEVLLSMTILLVLVVVLAVMNNESLALLRRSSSQAQMFQKARDSFELMNRQLSLATMNPYWDYDDPADPKRYLRKSWLAFVSGESRALLGKTRGPGQCVFFQAPLGRMEDGRMRELNLVLNTCGFYVEYGNANADAPAILNRPPRYRYRLMGVQTSAEEMGIYTSAPSGNDWITGAAASARVLAENVLLLVIRPLDASGADLAGEGYQYDSRLDATEEPQPRSSNQLPPYLEVTLIAASEESIARLDSGGGWQIAENPGWFTRPDQYAEDLADFEKLLKADRVAYRVFRQTVALPNSKWSD